ncbi:hypothetical protein J3458_020150 [Metarhizium acridum]|uniref:uncharacterized protein n=1 Tax=Metarhizium acridum TaxID=92637 RepID=UPI001C6AB48D|nr:hypothetical protein J3458_020150 [Metarhizium acridum]
MGRERSTHGRPRDHEVPAHTITSPFPRGGVLTMLSESSDWTLVTRGRQSRPNDEAQNGSFYSCSNLEPHHPGRYVKASDVRAQIAQIPDYDKHAKGKSKEIKNEYPKVFANIERFPDLASGGPRIEYPLKPKGVQMWRDSDRMGTSAGLHRAICDRDKVYRTGFDVVYHDVTKSQSPSNNLTRAIYRSAEEAAEKRKQERHKKHRRGEGSGSSKS